MDNVILSQTLTEVQQIKHKKINNCRKKRYSFVEEYPVMKRAVTQHQSFNYIIFLIIRTVYSTVQK